jgi:hypothetical protein
MVRRSRHIFSLPIYRRGLCIKRTICCPHIVYFVGFIAFTDYSMTIHSKHHGWRVTLKLLYRIGKKQMHWAFIWFPHWLVNEVHFFIRRITDCSLWLSEFEHNTSLCLTALCLDTLKCGGGPTVKTVIENRQSKTHNRQPKCDNRHPTARNDSDDR